MRTNILLPLACLALILPGCLNNSGKGPLFTEWDLDNDGVSNLCDVDYLADQGVEVVDLDLNGVDDSCQNDTDEDGLIDEIDELPLFNSDTGEHVLCEAWPSWDSISTEDSEYVAYRIVTNTLSNGYAGFIKNEYNPDAALDGVLAEAGGFRARGVLDAQDGLCDVVAGQFQAANLMTNEDIFFEAINFINSGFANSYGRDATPSDIDGDGIPNQMDLSFDIRLNVNLAQLIAEDAVYNDSVAHFLVRFQQDLVSQLVTMRIPVNVIQS